MSSTRRTINFRILRNTFLKCIGYLTLLVSVILAVPDTSFARVFAAFGPENFIRSSNGPATEVRQFQVKYPNDSEFNLHVFYGGIRKGFRRTIVPSALITLNGQQIIMPGEFSLNTRHIKKQVTLSGINTLSVEFRSKRESGVRVVITGKNDEPLVFDFSKTIQPDGGDLFGPLLSYRWAVVDQPKGGNAELLRRGSSSPSLGVDRPGEYSLELTIRGHGWEESFPLKLTATAYPPFVPVPVQTRVISGTGAQYQDYSIKVGPNTYSAPAPANCGSPSYEGFQILVLDRSTLEKKDHKTFNVPCGNQAMINFLSSLSNSSTYPVAPLVVVSSLSIAPPTDMCGNNSTCPLGSALEGLGGTSIFRSHYNETLSYTYGSSVNANFSYSLIGIPGLGQNQGTELNDWDHRMVTADSERISSNIEGYFIPDISKKWMFTYPEFVQIETRTRVTTGNIIKVGNDSYFSAGLPQYALGGFQVLVLDRDTLKPAASLTETNRSFLTNAGSGTGSISEQEQQEMYDYLNSVKQADPSQRFVVIIASIGSIGPPINYKSTVFNNLIKLIADYYGGTTGILYKLGAASSDPTIITTYSLLGLNNAENAKYDLGAADTIEESAPNRNLKVVMHKDRQGWYGPATTYSGAASAGTVSSPDFSLLPVALQAPVTWPIPNPADPLYQQQKAAYEYISSHLGENTNDIRSFYINSPKGDWQGNCNILKYPTSTPSPYFSPDDFNQMWTQLCDSQSGEINYVLHVNSFMDDMDILFLNMQVGSTTRLNNVYSMVKSTIHVDEVDQAKWDALLVIRGMLMVVSAVDPDPISSAAIGAMNGLLWLGMHLSTVGTGADYTSIETEVSSLATEMNNLWGNCQKGKNIMLDIVKSDWGKLEYVGKKLMTSQANGGWSYGDTDMNIWEDATINALESYYFKSLIPTAWKIDYMLDTSITSPMKFTYAATSNFGGSPFNCQPYCNGSTANPTAYELLTFTGSDHTWYVLEDEIVVEKNTTCGEVHYDRSVSLRDVLFNTGDWYDSSNNYVGVKLGLQRPVFFERWLPKSSYTHFIRPNGGEPTPESATCSD